MNLTILILLGAYVVYTLVWNFRHRGETPERLTVLSGLLQGPLMLLCIYYAYTAGAFGRELVNLGYITAGLVLGHLVFVLSILITQQDWRDAWVHSKDLRGFVALLRENPGPALRIISVAFTEEILYRAAVQPLLVSTVGSAIFAILLTAVLFSVVHEHFFQNSLLQSAEFFAFAVLLGVLYHWTGSLVLVGVVHSMRNLEIFYLEFLARCEELGDPVAAQEEIDAAHARRVVKAT